MKISDLLCDLYDIREMGKLCGFGKLPKDNEGTSFTIDEVVKDIKEYANSDFKKPIEERDHYVN